MNLPGKFVVLEGGDATGKTTQTARLAARLRAEGREVLATFEPGGTNLGVSLRRLLLDGQATVEPEAEALLMAADRAQHVLEVVRPALARGDWVVSDRFVPSSLAYQGVGRGLGVPAIEIVNGIATGGLEPDLVIVLDLPP
ncbi:MAG TPA: dTMP kinase, partial [Acidimicrobiia bacterium]|nr:dTMP kinase [Acidimicrobiia bacterium]